jgi:hypothetical protein
MQHAKPDAVSDEMDVDDAVDDGIEADPAYTAAKRLEYDAGHRTRAMQSFLKKVLATLRAHVRASGNLPLSGTLETILHADEQRDSADSQVLQRMSNKLDMIHAQLDFADVPSGDVLQTAIYQAAASPPFRRRSMARPLSIQQWTDLVLDEMALVSVGLVRLLPARYLLLAEWQADHVAHSGFAIVLDRHAPPTPSGAKDEFPSDLLLCLDGMTAIDKGREQFFYAGYMYVDSALVAAGAGMPDYASL